MKTQCPCCNGTSTLETAGTKSEKAILQTEIARMWKIMERLEDFVAAHMEVSSAAIASLVDDMHGARKRIRSQNGQILSLEKRLAIYDSWNCRTSDNPEHYKAIKEYKKDAQLHETGPHPEPRTGKKNQKQDRRRRCPTQ